MSLDLSELLADWEHRVGEPPARVVAGRDGRAVLQMRIDMGVLQMPLDGRPDGGRYHGMTNALEFIEHEMAVNPSDIADADWEELAREGVQYNYRRAGLASVADQQFSSDEEAEARPNVIRALRDAEICLRNIALTRQNSGEDQETDQHQLTLIFSRARLRTQLCAIDKQFDEAVEQAMAGRRELESLLLEQGLDTDLDDDPGVSYLRELEQRIRVQHSVPQTLRERLEMAVDQEDFEAAAAIRDELSRRSRNGDHCLPPPPDEPSNTD